LAAACGQEGVSFQDGSSHLVVFFLFAWRPPVDGRLADQLRGLVEQTGRVNANLSAARDNDRGVRAVSDLWQASYQEGGGGGGAAGTYTGPRA
jgi:hypothetical protein